MPLIFLKRGVSSFLRIGRLGLFFLAQPTQRVGHQRHRSPALIGKIKGFERRAFEMLNRFVWKTSPRMLVSKIKAGRGIIRNFFIREDKTPRCPRGSIAIQSTHEFLWFSGSGKRVGAPTLQPVFSKIGYRGFLAFTVSHSLKKPPSILFRSEFVLLAQVPPVFIRQSELKERMKLSAFFSERVAW